MSFDAFLKLTGIKGESTDAKHPDEIEIESFSWGLSNSSSHVFGGGGGSGQSSFQDFSFTADSSKASPLLFQYCANGKHINEALLTLRGAGAGGQAAEFYTVKLTDVLVSLYNQGGSIDGDRPMDEFALRIDKIEVDYDGVKAGWDVTSKKGL